MSEPQQLLAVYRDYLACLNARRWDDLGRFVADDVRYNDEPVGLAGYRAMLEADVDNIPDLQFVPEILLAADDVVSCRLVFRCTPRRRIFGVEPTGAQVTLAEHVFYRMVDARIVDVRSLIDTQAVRDQLSVPPASAAAPPPPTG